MDASEEYFDVVDPNDEVLRPETRSNVHRQGLLHRAVHIFVFNSSGQLFLQQRSLQKDSAPGKWCTSCSGHVNSGESYTDAAYRELSEEIGLSGVVLKPLFKEAPCQQTGNEFVWTYRCLSDGPFTLDPDEIIQGKWVEIDALCEWMKRCPRDFAWSFFYLWDRYCSN